MGRSYRQLFADVNGITASVLAFAVRITIFEHSNTTITITSPMGNIKKISQ